MIDLENLQILAQLIDNMETATNHLEEAYGKSNAEKFNLAKKEILDIQKKIVSISKG